MRGHHRRLLPQRLLCRNFSREVAMRFTLDEGRRYAIEYLRNDDGYSVRLYDVTGGSRQEIDWETWPACP